MSESSLEQRVADKFTAYKQGTFYINDHVNMRYARDVIALVREQIARDIEAVAEDAERNFWADPDRPEKEADHLRFTAVVRRCSHITQGASS